MARPLRIQVAGGFFHVTARGNRRQPIFVDNVDVECFLAMRPPGLVGGPT